MYEQFYGFNERPFTLLPDPAFLYFGKRHSTAYAMLEYGLYSQASFTVITGEVGSGKTTLIRHLLNQLGEDVTVGLVNSSHQDMGELLRWILLSFGLDHKELDKVSLHERFTRFLIEQYALNRRIVLIIDEAQNLKAEILEELRLLSNINADKDLVLQMVLVGQPELRSLLRKPELLQFIQRISVDYHLAPLSMEETIAYILHRTRCAGREKPIFTKKASLVIHKASKGIPRVINTLCDTVLVYGYVDQKQVLDMEVVMSVLADKQRSGLYQYGGKPTPAKRSEAPVQPAPEMKREPELLPEQEQQCEEERLREHEQERLREQDRLREHQQKRLQAQRAVGEEISSANASSTQPGPTETPESLDLEQIRRLLDECS